MGDRTEILNELERRNRSRAVEMVSQNPLIALASAVLLSGGTSAFGVDQFFGGSAARAERDEQIALVTQAASKASSQYQARIDGLDAKFHACQDTNQMLYDDLKACQDERTALAREIPVESTESAPPSAMEAIE